jgi:DNA end-binding protein Ku
MLDLAVHIVETKAGHFEPEKFEDHYENALKELIKKKQRGQKIEKPQERPQVQVINLMDALRQSAATERGGASSHPRRAAADHQRRLQAGRRRGYAR